MRNYFLLKIVFISLVLFSSCKSFKEAECTGVKGFKMNSMNAQGVSADVLLGIKNPNPIGFSIYPSEFDVVFGGVKLGKAKLKKRVHINANQEGTYTFTLKSDLKNVSLTDVMKLMGGGSKGMLEVKGDLKAGKFYLKKKFPVNVKERVG